MISLLIDNVQVTVPRTWTVLQTCEYLGKDIPKFCFHAHLQVAGNCRLCLVEVQNSLKPMASCALPLSPQLVVFTQTPLVQKARESVLEGLLWNHPLDCPICDQGGECDLQDQAWRMGSDRSRFAEVKRSVEDRPYDPYVTFILTRCIHCTRCVRFLEEYTQQSPLGMVGRGQASEISPYQETTSLTPWSGNLVDLCPVGALTNKPIQFRYRSWELNRIPQWDLTESLGWGIVVECAFQKALRILPQRSQGFPFLSNTQRFQPLQQLVQQRLGSVWFQRHHPSALQEVAWSQGLAWARKCLASADGHTVEGYLAGLSSLETLHAWKRLFQQYGARPPRLGSQGFHRFAVSSDFVGFFLWTMPLSRITRMDACWIVQGFPQRETPLFWLLLQKRLKQTAGVRVQFGLTSRLSATSQQGGFLRKHVQDLVEGKHPFCRQMIHQRTPLLLSEPLPPQWYRLLPPSFCSRPWFGLFWLGFSRRSLLHLEHNGILRVRGQRQLSLQWVYTDHAGPMKDPLSFQKGVTSRLVIGTHWTSLCDQAHYVLPVLHPWESCGTYLTQQGNWQRTSALPVRMVKSQAKDSFLVFHTGMLKAHKTHNNPGENHHSSAFSSLHDLHSSFFVGKGTVFPRTFWEGLQWRKVTLE